MPPAFDSMRKTTLPPAQTFRSTLPGTIEKYFHFYVNNMQFSPRALFTFIMLLAFAIAMIHAEIDAGSLESANAYPAQSRLHFQKKWSRLEPSIRFFKRSGYPEASFDEPSYLMI